MRYRSLSLASVVLVISVCMLSLSPMWRAWPLAEAYSVATPQDCGTLLDTSTELADSGEQYEANLLPVAVEHSGESANPIVDRASRTDTSSAEIYELLLPSGGPDNTYSALCTGGYFTVGGGGLTTFGSAAGTISFWMKWHGTAPNGRPWGQHDDFEIRWSNGHVLLDWGGTAALTGQKSDWAPDRWYFLAFAWDDELNQIFVYWADEYNPPNLDISTSAWLWSVVGLLTQNNIMNSRGMAYQTNGHIDAFRYFNVCRSLDDIRADYRTELTLSEVGLVHTYCFEGDLVDNAGSADLASTGTTSYSKDVVFVDDWWQADQMDVEVEGLERLLATGGTFDDGVPGTNADWSGDGAYHPDGWFARRQVTYTNGIQRAAYVKSDGGHVTLQNEGYAVDSPTRYRHYDDTVIYWYQQVNNSDIATSFLLGFSYLYENGPIGTSYRNAFSLRIQVLDGASLLWEWTLDPTTLSYRDTWYAVNGLSLSIPAGHASLEIRASLEVRLTSTYVSLYQTNGDLDGNPANGLFVTMLVDNFSLVSSEPPTCSEVGLAVVLPFLGQVPLNGTAGQGHLTASYESWSEASILFHFSSTSPVAFVFSARLSHTYRSENSSSGATIDKIGVSCRVEPNADVTLTTYAYVPSHDEVTNLTLRILHPRDWTRATILNGLGQDVSSQCFHGLEAVEVPSRLLRTLGWWQLTFISPNYAKNITTEAYRESTWLQSTALRNSDIARSVIVIGTLADCPFGITGLLVSWSQPDDAVWFNESLQSSSGNSLVGSPLSFGATNSTVGQWSVSVVWTNGTEVAFGECGFELHHNAELEPTNPTIEASLGDIGMGSVVFRDTDNGKLIMDLSAIIFGNWSESILDFRPNLATLTWDAHLNTTQLGTGSFIIIINGSLQFYDISPCSLVLRVLTTTVLEIRDSEFVLIGLGETGVVQLAYKYHDGTGILGADMSVIMWTGPENGLTWQPAEPVPSEPGIYTMDFNSNASGTFHVFVAASKEYHQTSSTSFYLIVGQIQTHIDLVNGSADTTTPDAPYRLLVRYSNATGSGIANANIWIVSVTPTTGLTYNPSEYLGNGTYSVLLIPENYGAFSILVGAELANYGSQYSVFTLTVSPMNSILRTVTSVGSVAIDRTYAVYFILLSENLTGLEGADIYAISIDPIYGVQVGSTTELGNGSYFVVLAPLTKGTYELVFRAVLAQYQNGTVAFTLIATEVPTVLMSKDGSTSADLHYGETLNITLFYQRSDTGTNITSAAFTVSTSPGLFTVVHEENGCYVLTVWATATAKWQLTVTASRTDYRNGTLVYQIEFREIPTEVAGTGIPSVLFYDTEYTFALRFQSDSHVGLTCANVTVPVNPPQTLQWSEVGDGYYKFELTTSNLGTYELTVRFAAYGYASAEYSVLFQVIPMDTSLECHCRPQRFLDTRSYVIALYYESATGGGIEGATLAYSADIRSFVAALSVGFGWYNLTLFPSLGEWNATFYLTKFGYSEGLFTFLMVVGLIPIVLDEGYEFNETYSMTEGRILELHFAFIANDTRDLMSDASVTFQISRESVSGPTPVLTGSFVYESGVYTASFVVPAAGLYTLTILVENVHCASLHFEGFLVSQTDVTGLWASVLRAGMVVVALLLTTSASVYFGRGISNARKESKRRELLDLRGRMDDAERTIGLLILHSKRGLPIFSKIVKGGFDETMVSGFISAITSFREELAIEEKLGIAIPISDVITAVRTRTLTCALLTVEPPSKRQVANLQEFARSTADLLGDSQEISDALSQDLAERRKHLAAIARLFDAKMDGPLLCRYRGLSSGPVPDQFSQLQSAVESLADEDFSLGMLASALAGSGMDERRSLSLVIGAAEGGLLITVGIPTAESS